MFLRSITLGEGKYTYLRLVENYREREKVKQRVVAHLGRKDLLAPHLDSLVRALQAEDSPSRWVKSDEISAPEAWSWGPVLVARHLFEELSLSSILDGPRAGKRDDPPLSERVFPLVASRLSWPGSEHALAQWLEDFYVCTRSGSRWMPKWKESGRVKVDFRQLRMWYQTLDQLLVEKERVEKAVYFRLRDLFSIRAELIFYDITSTYFEGEGPAEIAKFGYSRDQRPRNRQVLIGVVMMDGWPIAHHVFAGNRLDGTTVEEVVADLNKRFEIERIVFVGDRGMVSVHNIMQLRNANQGYLVGLQRRNRKAIYDYIREAESRGRWEECPAGIAAYERKPIPRTRVQEVAGKEPGVRVFVVDSEERALYERSMRELSMERTGKALEAIRQRVEKGTLNEPHKIGAAVARALARHHGHRYFTWRLKDRAFSYAEHPISLAREKALEGKCLIQTEEQGISPVQAVAAYKLLNDVERGFAHLKGLLEIRPIHHRREQRVRAHIFVAALAFLVDRALEKKLRQANSTLSSPFAWSALETIRCVKLNINGDTKLCVTRGSRHAAQVLRAVGVTSVEPPPPPQNEPTIM
ncbi:MAG: IS1634 family transposase [Acidobacteriota bacterium]